MSRLPVITPRTRKVATVAGSVVGGLLVLDLIGFLATAYFGAEVLQYARRAGVEGLLRR